MTNTVIFFSLYAVMLRTTVFSFDYLSREFRDGFLFSRSGCQFKIEDLIQESYDKTRPPKGNNGEPTVVQIGLHILDIPSIKDNTYTYDMAVFFNQMWEDSRLKIPPSCQSKELVFDNKWKDYIWVPDVFFRNSRSGHLLNILIPYTYIILLNNSQLFMASRLSLSLHCHLNLKSFPHDMQTCSIALMSMRYGIDKVVLRWKDFSVSEDIDMPQYYISGTYSEEMNTTQEEDSFSVLLGMVQLQRRQGYYVLNYFFPSVLIVIASFVTFWLPPSAYPARVALTLTPLLTIVTQSYRGTNPSVSYIMAMNIWTMGCISFVFATLIEYAVVVFLWHRDKKKKTAFSTQASEKRMSENRDSDAYVTADEDKKRTSTVPDVRLDVGTSEDPVASAPKSRKLSILVDYENEYDNLLDGFSRIVFPLLFFIFAVAYWIVHAKK